MSPALAQPDFSELPASVNTMQNAIVVNRMLPDSDSTLTAWIIRRKSNPDDEASAHKTNVILVRVRADYGTGSSTRFAYDAISKLHQELESYAQLEDDWDGNGAKAPSQTAVDDALTFLDARPTGLSLPYPEEGTEGDVGIYWEDIHSQVFAEVNFEGDGTYAYFAVRGTPGNVLEKCGKDAVDVNGPWPEDLQNILRRIVIA